MDLLPFGCSQWKVGQPDNWTKHGLGGGEDCAELAERGHRDPGLTGGARRGPGIQQSRGQPLQHPLSTGRPQQRTQAPGQSQTTRARLLIQSQGGAGHAKWASPAAGRRTGPAGRGEAEQLRDRDAATATPGLHFPEAPRT